MSTEQDHIALTQPVEVLLICMPFGARLRPSLGLSMLAAQLANAAVKARVLYFTLEFAEIIGTGTYDLVSDGFPSSRFLVGEWIFGEALTGERDDNTAGYLSLLAPSLQKQLSGGNHSFLELTRYLRTIRQARQAAVPFIERAAQTCIGYDPRIVAFTSVFQQHAASLALAKRLKSVRPDLKVIFGGANCEQEMGLETLRQFPFVDVVVSGEADEVFVGLVASLLNGRRATLTPGVHVRESGTTLLAPALANAPLVHDLDTLPVPDYTSYFEELTKHPLEANDKPSILFESSRGCWWGEKSQCTFCGLNGTSMAFRSKSASRVLRELDTLHRRHPDCAISVVDNILDHKYFRDVIPELARRQDVYSLFYEVKSNLTKPQLCALHAAGIRTIQPGIESFSDDILMLMKKGVTGLQNVQLLKWCRELGIHASWNLLTGFPDEEPSEYERMAALLPLMTHLTPPESIAPIRLDRFSPNYDQAAEQGLVNVRPAQAYEFIYRLPPAALRNLAYFFDFDYADRREVASYTDTLAKAAAAWKRVHSESTLTWVDAPDGIRSLLYDRRPLRDPAIHLYELSGPARWLYATCDRAISVPGILDAADRTAETSERWISEMLMHFVERGLMASDGRRYLSLAVRHNRLPAEIDENNGCTAALVNEGPRSSGVLHHRCHRDVPEDPAGVLAR